MENICGTIYQIARKSAGLTQRQAVELLHVSESSLSAYERGITSVPDDIVKNMIEQYGTKWLGYQHLQTTTLIGQMFLPPLNLTDVAKAVLRLQKEINDVRNINSEMVDIACDGIVEDGELRRWLHVTKEVREVAEASLAVVFSHTEKDKKIATV